MRRLSASHFAQTTCGKHENPVEVFSKVSIKVSLGLPLAPYNL